MHFGTDGIRGSYPDHINEGIAFALGHAVATVFGGTVLVGHDPRESSPSLALATLAGLRAGGATPVNLGEFTTPGVAVEAAVRGCAGIVVSASHNPWHDNGLKVFDRGGTKLTPERESALEEALQRAPRAPESFDDVPVDENAGREYLRHLHDLVPGDLSSMHIVLDCANGAASHFAPDLFRASGATVSVIHAEPSGRNINDECGSTHPADLIATVRERGADVGLAFDGDADRLIAVDARGDIRDGDDLMVLFGLDFHERHVRDQGVVITHMSNLGLKRALSDAGVALVEVGVGDRNVLVALDDNGWSFGGEQSGHLLFRDMAPTGDGMLTGLMLCELIARKGPLHELAAVAWHRVPQVLINIPLARYDASAVAAIVNDLIRDYAVVETDVRVLIRPSGTEPVVRVMVEALDEALVEAVSAALASFVDS